MSQARAVTLQPTLTLTGAEIATIAARKHADKMGIPMNIAIVDSATHLLSFVRMPGAKTTSISIAIDKAFTAAGHRLGTDKYKDTVWPGGAAYGINGSNGGRFTVIAGGLPVLGINGEVLGAIGCSTGTPAQDLEVASAGKEAIEKHIKEEGQSKPRSKL